MKEQSKMAVIKTFSMTIEHVGKVSDMAQRLGCSQSEVLRKAIDLLWREDALTPNPVSLDESTRLVGEGEEEEAALATT